jgi:hypothetical protein
MGTEFPSIRAALRAREKHIEMFDLIQSIESHSHIPSTFDGDLPSAVFSDGKLLACRSAMSIWRLGQMARSSCTVNVCDGWISGVAKCFWGMTTDGSAKQVRKTRTPLELFDFMHESYKNTKEKLLEWMATAKDFADLKKLSQS